MAHERLAPWQGLLWGWGGTLGIPSIDFYLSPVALFATSKCPVVMPTVVGWKPAQEMFNEQVECIFQLKCALFALLALSPTICSIPANIFCILLLLFYSRLFLLGCFAGGLASFAPAAASQSSGSVGPVDRQAAVPPAEFYHTHVSISRNCEASSPRI